MKGQTLLDLVRQGGHALHFGLYIVDEGLAKGKVRGWKVMNLSIKMERDLKNGTIPTPQHPYDDLNNARSKFDGAELAPTMVDTNETLSKDQHLSSLAKVVKTKDLPKREGIGPLTPRK